MLRRSIRTEVALLAVVLGVTSGGAGKGQRSDESAGG
jgi:hypothetical protein